MSTVEEWRVSNGPLEAARTLASFASADERRVERALRVDAPIKALNASTESQHQWNAECIDVTIIGLCASKPDGTTSTQFM
jgi:hypothetical protein